jgi:hypothetical protein
MAYGTKSGNMSRETFLRELARRGMVASDLNPQDEADRIASSAPAMVGEALPLNNGAVDRALAALNE